MPIKTRYHVVGGGKNAPYYSGYDRTCASYELDKMLRHSPEGTVLWISPEVIPVEPLTKAEQYLLLVYDVRRLMRRYFSNGRKREDLDASIAKETQLDHWNRKVRSYIDSRPGFETLLKGLSPDTERARHFAFFEVVEEWRKIWKEYHCYRKRKDKDPAVEAEMRKKCFEFEHAIDGYINQTLNL